MLCRTYFSVTIINLGNFTYFGMRMIGGNIYVYGGASCYPRVEDNHRGHPAIDIFVESFEVFKVPSTCILICFS